MAKRAQNSSGLKGKGEKYPIGEKKGKALEIEKSDPWVLWNTSKLSGRKPFNKSYVRKKRKTGFREQ